MYVSFYESYCKMQSMLWMHYSWYRGQNKWSAVRIFVADVMKGNILFSVLKTFHRACWKIDITVLSCSPVYVCFFSWFYKALCFCCTVYTAEIHSEYKMRVASHINCYLKCQIFISHRWVLSKCWGEGWWFSRFLHSVKKKSQEINKQIQQWHDDPTNKYRLCSHAWHILFLCPTELHCCPNNIKNTSVRHTAALTDMILIIVIRHVASVVDFESMYQSTAGNVLRNKTGKTCSAKLV